MPYNLIVTLVFARFCIFSNSLAQAMFDLWNTFIHRSSGVGLEIPKTHLMSHVNLRSKKHGNPWRYTTFLDESLNKDLKRVLRNCHQANFEVLAMFKLSSVLDRSAKRQRLVG